MAYKQVLVSYQEKNKVLLLTAGGSDIENLNREFRREFKIMSKAAITFQCYDSSWEEYIDLEDGQEIQNKAKLKAIISEEVSYLIIMSEQGLGMIYRSFSFHVCTL